MQNFRRMLIYKPTQWGSTIFSKRQCSNTLIPSAESAEKRNYLFSLEQKRQLEEVGRVEKIKIHVCGPPEDVVLEMNKNISTPYDCCKHISLPLCQRSPLAVLNDKILWDMHRPLPGDCKITFLSFKDKDPFMLNEVFWRTGSFVLGAVVSKSFKDEVTVLLHEFPSPVVCSGSFIYDVQMNLTDWIPTADELKILSGEFLTFVLENHKIEVLTVKKSLAAEILGGNPFKISQLQKLASETKDKLITLYRVGNHIDVSTGPMLGDTSFFGRCSVTAVHKISNFKMDFYRFQGIALPKGIMLNNYAYGILIDRAQKLNEADVPDLPKYFQPSEGLQRLSKTNITDDPLLNQHKIR